MTNSVSVKFVGSNLVASFANSQPPLVWNFDLQKNPSFTLALREDKDWLLGVTSFKGEFDEVARFSKHDDALDAFAQVQKKLMKGRRSCFGWLILSHVAVVIIALGALLGFAHFERSQMLHKPVSVNVGPHTMEDGIPLSADDVLKPPH